MQRPALDDTIVAISSGWRASPLGIVRISGPDARRLLGALDSTTARDPGAGRAAARDSTIALDGLRLPARIVTFVAPLSFTGQDVVELYVPGSLPLLRRLADGLVARGARQALPGEFSARAYLNAKLTAVQAEGVLGLIHAADGVAARQAARLARGTRGRDLDHVREALLDLLARLEAGIDFADEEDIRFITAAEMRARIDQILRDLPQHDAFNRRERPHVVLAGLPNAGKSSLFNALVGAQRTIVSPIAGTTRDVIAAEIELDGIAIVLQDSAGIAAGSDEVDRAANCAADAAIETAELVLWVHDAAQPWSPQERRLLAAAPSGRVLHVLSKIDLAPPASSPGIHAAAVPTSAKSRRGLDALRSEIASRAHAVSTAPTDSRFSVIAAGMTRARHLIGDVEMDIVHPELIAIEFRNVLEILANVREPSVDEAVLGVIFSKFCIGK